MFGFKIDFLFFCPVPIQKTEALRRAGTDDASVFRAGTDATAAAAPPTAVEQLEQYFVVVGQPPEPAPPCDATAGTSVGPGAGSAGFVPGIVPRGWR